MLFFTLPFRLLRAGTTGGAPLPPLEVECKPLWQPENVARAFCPIRVARTLDRMPLRKSCLSAGEQLSFIRRLARRFWATTGFGCMCLKTLCRFSKKIGNGRGRALRFDMADIIHTLNDLISSCRDSEEGFG